MSDFENQADVIETGECAFCPSPVPVFDEGTLVGKYQILVEDGAPYIVCERCWWKAWHGTSQEDVSHIGGVAIIHAHA